MRRRRRKGLRVRDYGFFSVGGVTVLERRILTVALIVQYTVAL